MPELSERPTRWSKTSHLLATGFGAGYVPLIPGTIGSLWGLPLVWGIQLIVDDPLVRAVLAAIIFFAGILICGAAEKQFEKEDPGQIVFDEIAAFPVVFLFVEMTLLTAVIGFVLFRLFDIFKPWPIRKIERLPGGLGVMADDLVAGIYAAAGLLLTHQVLGMFESGAG
jgi:phosphatidylglycerophosphatase A